MTDDAVWSFSDGGHFCASWLRCQRCEKRSQQPASVCDPRTTLVVDLVVERLCFCTGPTDDLTAMLHGLAAEGKPNLARTMHLSMAGDPAKMAFWASRNAAAIFAVMVRCRHPYVRERPTPENLFYLGLHGRNGENLARRLLAALNRLNLDPPNVHDVFHAFAPHPNQEPRP